MRHNKQYSYTRRVDLSAYLIRIGLNIRRLRKRTKLRQIDVAEELGMGYRRYQDIEGGKINMTLKTSYEIARYFKIPLEDLFKK